MRDSPQAYVGANLPDGLSRVMRCFELWASVSAVSPLKSVATKAGIRWAYLVCHRGCHFGRCSMEIPCCRQKASKNGMLNLLN